MTPLSSQSRLQARQLYDPEPGSVTASDLVKMTDRKKKQLSDWAVGALMLAIQKKEIRKVDADLFQSVFVRGAVIRKTRKHAGHPFTGPSGEIMTIAGIEYPGGLENTSGLPRLAMEFVESHPRHDEWISNYFRGAVPSGPWLSERDDSPDEAPVPRNQTQALTSSLAPSTASGTSAPASRKRKRASTAVVPSPTITPPPPDQGGKTISPEMWKRMQRAKRELNSSDLSDVGKTPSLSGDLIPDDEPVAKGKGRVVKKKAAVKPKKTAKKAQPPKKRQAK